MNEKIKSQLGTTKQYWQDRSKKQKGLIIGSLLGIIVLAAVLTYVMTKQDYVPLYSNLPPAEAGQVKEELDAKGVISQLADNGKTILVPATVADALKVELASKGIPKSGVIDYGYFGEKSGISMTDNEFNVVKLEAMQNELSKLMKGIDGIEEANVMITIPNETIWVKDKNNPASASIVLQTVPGHEFGEKEIKTLYHLVSRSVPNLPTDNIAITNQNFDNFDLDTAGGTSVANYETQRKIKKDVERDIQRQVQQLLSTMMGKDKVAVFVSADLDFKQENRTEELVEPVDKENMQGIAVSVERIKETYSGKKESNTGIAGTGETDIPGYPSGNQNGEGSESKKNEERINYEINRIKKEIVESPYKVKDLGIQVAIEPPTAGDTGSLPQQTVSDIEKMLSSIVKTSITKDDNNQLTQADVQEKISVTVTDFKGKSEDMTKQSQMNIPWWLYVIGGILLLVIIVLIVMLVRRQKYQEEMALALEEEDREPIYVADVNEVVETEELVRRKQLEKMAKEKPDEFTKIIKAWLAEE